MCCFHYIPLILAFGVEILRTKLKLRKVVRESLVIAHVKVPKNPLPGFPFIAKIQDARHEIQLFCFFYLSTLDGGDFPRIIEIALLDIFLKTISESRI